MSTIAHESEEDKLQSVDKHFGFMGRIYKNIFAGYHEQSSAWSSLVNVAGSWFTQMGRGHGEEGGRNWEIPFEILGLCDFLQILGVLGLWKYSVLTYNLQ